MKRLLLIDGHSVIYRSFFAFIRAPLRNSKGFNTSAVYGFAQCLKKLLKDLKPDYCAVVYDAPGRTFAPDAGCERDGASMGDCELRGLGSRGG